jgi:hypothetical protein
VSGSIDTDTAGRDELVREVLRLRAMLREQMEAAPGVGDSIEVDGIVAVRDDKPLVRMRGGEATWSFTPEQAREHALATLCAAIEAERDASTIAFLKETGADMAGIGSFMTALRQHRTEWRFTVERGPA